MEFPIDVSFEFSFGLTRIGFFIALSIFAAIVGTGIWAVIEAVKARQRQKQAIEHFRALFNEAREAERKVFAVYHGKRPYNPLIRLTYKQLTAYRQLFYFLQAESEYRSFLNKIINRH